MKITDTGEQVTRETSLTNPLEEKTFPQKVKDVILKIGQRNMIIICAVLIIGVAVALNFILFRGDDGTKDGMNLAIDMTNLNGADGQTNSADQLNQVSSNENYFVTTAISRQRARDEAIEFLEAIVANSDSLEEVKDKALSDISQIALDIEREVNIETLIMSKGFSQCVAVINGELANIIVSTEGLLPNEVAQINEIVYEQSGIIPSNVKIIEKAIAS